MNPVRWPLMCVMAMLLAVNLAIYLQVLSQDFEGYDTTVYVTDNPHVRDGFSSESVAWAFDPRHGYAANWHPLTWLSHMLDCQLFGLDRPGAHKAVNVLLHVLNSWLLFLALWLLTRPRENAQRTPDKSQARAVPFDWLRLGQCAFVALLFAVHPLHVESVAWVAERKDVLSGLFWMLTLIAYAWYAVSPGWQRMSLVALALALGLMSKPMLVTLPFVLLLLDAWPLARAGVARLAENLPDWRQVIVEKLPLFALVAISSVLTYLVQKQGGAVNLSPSLAQRVAGAIWAYGMYLGQMVWPVNLACFYPRPPAESNPFSLPVLIVAGVLLAITVWVVVTRARAPYLLVGWFWYLGTLVPVNGLFVQVGEQAHADRYTYIPLIGIFIMLAWGLPDLLARWRTAGYYLAGAAALASLVLAVLSFRQVQTWQSSEALFRHAALVTTDNAFAHASWGAELRRRGKLAEALRECQQAVDIDPDDWNNQVNLALVLSDMQRLDEAHSAAEKAVRLSPAEARATATLARVLGLQKRIADALAMYEKSIALDPNIAQVHVYYAQLLMEQGRLNEAGQQFETALRIDSHDNAARMFAAMVWAADKNWAKAEAHLQQILAADPQRADARLLEAQIQMQREQYPQAIASYRKILARTPDVPDANNNLAWMLATQGKTAADIAEAVQAAERSCRVTQRQDPALLDTLALAYATANRFEDAVKTLDEAIAIALKRQQPELAKQLERTRETYRVGKLK